MLVDVFFKNKTRQIHEHSHCFLVIIFLHSFRILLTLDSLEPETPGWVMCKPKRSISWLRKDDRSCLGVVPTAEHCNALGKYHLEKDSGGSFHPPRTRALFCYFWFPRAPSRLLARATTGIATSEKLDLGSCHIWLEFQNVSRQIRSQWQVPVLLRRCIIPSKALVWSMATPSGQCETSSSSCWLRD